VGFCLIVLTYSLTLAFFAWALATPPLDRIWELHHQLKTGTAYALTRADRELASSALERYPALAEALLSAGQIGIISAQRDGWVDTPEVTILRTPRATLTQRILLEVQTPPQHLPFRVTLAGSGWQRSIDVQARGTLALELPAPGAVPELLSLKLEGAGLRADSSSIAVRVTFDPPGDTTGAASDEDEEEREEDAADDSARGGSRQNVERPE
jgi:hypothetical protein